MRNNLIQSTLVFGLSAALALAPLPAASAPPGAVDGPNIRQPPKGDGQGPYGGGGQQPYRGDGQDGRRPHGTSIWTLLIPAAVVGIGLCAAYCGKDDHKTETRKDPDDPPDRQDLLENGPHVSDTAPFGAYGVYGFVRNGWPIVVDYDSDPQSAVWITVTVGDRSWTQGLEGGRHYVNIPYQGGEARGSTPALFTVQSAVRGTNPPVPSRLDIIGIGSGPRAVGSVAIHDLAFAPSARQVGGDYARYGYQASSPFNKAAAEIVRFRQETRDNVPVIVATQVASYDRKAVLAGPFGPSSWDGREAKSRQASKGLHRLQVRGWETDEDESWVSALSTGSVAIK